jgi:hypothetical protein
MTSIQLEPDELEKHVRHLEGPQTTAKSLGVVYIDDHAQGQSLLKVDDPKG